MKMIGLLSGSRARSLTDDLEELGWREEKGDAGCMHEVERNCENEQDECHAARNKEGEQRDEQRSRSM